MGVLNKKNLQAGHHESCPWDGYHDHHMLVSKKCILQVDTPLQTACTIGMHTYVEQRQRHDRRRADKSITLRPSQCFYRIGIFSGFTIFHREDILLEVPIVVNSITQRDTCQLTVDENICRVKSKRVAYNYQSGHKRTHSIFGQPNTSLRLARYC